MKRSEFHELETPKLLSDYERPTAKIVWYEYKAEVEGLGEGEAFLAWDERSLDGATNDLLEMLTPGYDGPGMAWCKMHHSIIKDGRIIADKIVGFS